MYASVNYAIIGSHDGLSPIRRQFQWHFKQNTTIVIEENGFEIAVWKMVVTLSRPQCVET